MKIATCGKYFEDTRVPKEDFEMFGRSCATCVHCNSITGCEVTPRGKDIDSRTYLSLSGRIYKDED